MFMIADVPVICSMRTTGCFSLRVHEKIMQLSGGEQLHVSNPDWYCTDDEEVAKKDRNASYWPIQELADALIPWEPNYLMFLLMSIGGKTLPSIDLSC